MDEISKEIAAHNARSNTYTKKYMAQLKRKLGIESDYALAKALQVSKTTVSNYSNGTTAFSARVCHRVADLLEIHPALVVSAIEIDRHSGAEQKEIDTWTYIHRAMAKAKIAAVNLSVVLACAIVIFATEGALFSNEAVAMSADSGLYIMSNQSDGRSGDTSQPASASTPDANPTAFSQIDDIRDALRRLGASPRHAHRALRLWSQALPQDSGSRDIATFLPASLRAALPAFEQRLDAIARIQSVHPGADGERLLIELADGQTVESVLLPRDGLCISSQVGCGVGCVFCMTGQGGLQRQVGSAEMVAQVVLARRRRVVKKVVFMGMGEPAHNLDNVLDAIDLLGTAGNIGHKNLVLSTVGDARVFARLSQATVRPALAISLHSTDPARRAELLPRAPRFSPAELVAAADAYARASGYPIQYQWTLLAGINDTDDEIDGLVQLLSGRYGVLNLIPFNAVEGLSFQRPPWDAATEMARRLHRRGILTKLRRSAAQDVDGGCGQLRARSARRIPIRAVAA